MVRESDAEVKMTGDGCRQQCWGMMVFFPAPGAGKRWQVPAEC